MRRAVPHAISDAAGPDAVEQNDALSQHAIPFDKGIEHVEQIAPVLEDLIHERIGVVELFETRVHLEWQLQLKPCDAGVAASIAAGVASAWDADGRAPFFAEDFEVAFFGERVSHQRHSARISERLSRLETIAVVAQAAPMLERILQAHIVVGFCGEPGIEAQAVAGEEAEGRAVDEAGETERLKARVVERRVARLSPAHEVDAHFASEVHRVLDECEDVGGVFAFGEFAALDPREDDALEIVIEERDVAVGQVIEYPVELGGFADDVVWVREDARPCGTGERSFICELWQVAFESVFVREPLAFWDADQRSGREQVCRHCVRPGHRRYDDLHGGLRWLD